MKEYNECLTRLNKIIEFYGLNVSSFARMIGSSVSTINSLYVRDAEPSLKICVQILNAFEDISTDWLVLGKGEMLKSKSVSVEQSNINNGSVSGDLNQSISNVSTDELAKIKLMLKGCSTIEEFQFVANIINKATNQ